MRRCGRWATATSDRTTRVPGQLSVRLRCLDVRQELRHSPRRGVVVRRPAVVGPVVGCVRALGLPTGGLRGRHGL
ncbi:DUF6207 family protein [Streptomyces caelestis]|uniref:DUF6207 family protein n=1 Tax=Streptomyces caelestis TaxID=36816 RepID=UPI0036F67E5A